MIGIGQFFHRIQNTFTKEVLVRKLIVGSVKENTNVDIPIESIVLKNGVVFLKNISNTAKSVVYIKKSKIIQQVNDQQQVRLILDIK